MPKTNFNIQLQQKYTPVFTNMISAGHDVHLPVAFDFNAFYMSSLSNATSQCVAYGVVIA